MGSLSGTTAWLSGDALSSISSSSLLIATVGTPALLGLLAVLLGRLLPPLRTALTIAATVANLLLVVVLAPLALTTGVTSTFAVIHAPGADLPLTLALDRTSEVILLVLALVTLAIGLALSDASIATRRPSSTLFFWLLAVGSVNGVLVSGDLLTLYVCSWGLSLALLGLSAVAADEASTDAGIWAVAALEGTGMLLLTAIVWVQWRFGDLSVGGVAVQLRAEGVESWRMLAVALALPFAARAGLFPLHTWLSGLSRALASPIAGWVSASVATTGAYLILRYLWPGDLAWEPWRLALLTVGSLSMAAGAVGAYWQSRIRPTLTFVVLAHAGLVALSLGVGTERALAAAALQVTSQTVYLVLLFVSLGALASEAGSDKISDLGAGATRAPLAALGVVVGTLCAMGAPGLAGYVPRLALLEACLETGTTQGQAIAAVVFLACGIMTVPLVRVLASLASADWTTSITVRWGGKEAAIGLLTAACVVAGVAPGLASQGVALPVAGEGISSGFFYVLQPLSIVVAVTLIISASLALGLYLYLRFPRPALVSTSGLNGQLLGVASGPDATLEVRATALSRVFASLETGRMDPYRAVGSIVTLTARVSAFLLGNTLGRLSR